MTDDSSDEYESDFTLYKNRPEWKDVTPVPQDDGDDPVVAIDYTEVFRDVFDYFRAIVKSGEKSDRALELTKDAANLNPANYTVWQYRREILKTLNKDLQEELDFIGKVIIQKQLKNYQVWHHRKVLVELLQDPSKEKQLTEAVLAKDAKNYHAWQHRQWILKTFNLFEGELEYTETLLSDDIRNNSAWNQRYFVINNTTGFSDEVLNREITYTLKSIEVLTENESAWNYLRGLLLHDKKGLSYNDAVTKACRELYDSGNKSPFLLALLVDMCSERISQNCPEEPVYNLKWAKQLCDDLALKHDTVRGKYWKYMEENIERKAKGEPEIEANCSTNVDQI